MKTIIVLPRCQTAGVSTACASDRARVGDEVTSLTLAIPHSFRASSRRLLPIRWLLPLLLLALSTAVQAQFSYQTIGGTITITGGCQAGPVTIPSTINGLPVTSIGDHAFYGCSRLTSVTIPNSVTAIGLQAFEGCNRLTSVTIPNSVTTIGQLAFEGCTSLPSVTIPNSVITIDHNAFMNCSSLTSVAIPNSVTTIEGNAFSGCTSLTSVTIPNSVTTIEGNAFSGCTSLTGIYVDAGNTSFSSVEGVLFDQRRTRLIQYPGGKAGSHTIPNSVTSIGEQAFFGSRGLTSVTVPSSVTTIGVAAFDSCSDLTAIHVDGGNTSFSSVEGVLFDQSRTTLLQYPGGKAGSYTIPNSVTTIGLEAFYGCSSLTSVTIPNSVITIDQNAFMNCSSLTSVTIPNSVTTIGPLAFQGCSDLTAIYVDAGNASFSSLEGVLFDHSRTSLIQYPGGKAGSYTIPDSVTTIGQWAFSYCSRLTGVTILNSVTTIGESAFSRCTSLTSVRIPKSVAAIERWAFWNCASLTDIQVDAGNASFSSVEGVLFDQSRTRLIQYPLGKAGSYTIPNSVITIEGGAFRDCTSLTSVTIPNSVTSIGYGVFLGCSGLTSVYFEGNASGDMKYAFVNCPVAIVFYRAGTTGWTDFYQRPTALWVAPPSYPDWLPLSALPTRYPQATAEVDDPDEDGMTNRAEMLAGTDPTDSFSTLGFESVPRPGDSTDADRTPLGATQHAVYVRTVPGKTYGVQWADALDGSWRLDAVVTATTTQTRFVFGKPEGNRLYRVILAQ